MAGVLVLCLPPELADEFSQHAPDFWSIRGETFRLNVPTAAAPAWQNAIFSRLLRDTAALSASGWIHLTIPQADVMVALDGEPERTIERAQRAGDLALALNLHERGLQYLWRGHDRKAALCFSASLRLRSDGHTPSALWFPTARLVFWAHHRCALPVPPGTIESVLTWINKLPPERELRPSSIELALLVDALVRGGEAWLGVEIFRRYQHDFEDSVYAISDIYGHAQSDRERWSGQIVLPIFQESGSWKKQIFQGKSALRDLGLLLNAEDHNRIGEPFYRETLALLRGRFMDVWLRLGESATAPEPPRGQAPYSLGDLERLVLTSGLLAIERSEWPARSRCWISALPAPPQPWGSGLVLLDELALCWWCFYRRQVAELAELRGDQLEARAAWGELRSGLETLRLYPAAAEYAQGLGELAG